MLKFVVIAVVAAGGAFAGALGAEAMRQTSATDIRCKVSLDDIDKAIKEATSTDSKEIKALLQPKPKP